MGQKVHPISFRLGINRNWDSRWFAGKEYANYVLEDFQVRKFLKQRVAVIAHKSALQKTTEHIVAVDPPISAEGPRYPGLKAGCVATDTIG